MAKKEKTVSHINVIKMKCLIILIVCLFQFEAHLAGQDWSSWANLESNDNSSIQYCFKLYPVTSGNSFSLKIKNISLSNQCGDFEVVLNMINGQKKLSYGFKDLKPGIERSCHGVYQFADVKSFGSITDVKINNCGESDANSRISPASFIIAYHNEVVKHGKFIYVDPNGEFSFEASASSGLQKAANNPYTQSFKGQGLIPSGTWKIELIVEPETEAQRELNRYPPIFKLTPIRGVELSSLKSDKFRDGFLIHSGRNPLTASQGCIILDINSRQKLKKAILKYGSIELTIQNKVY